MLSKPKDDRLEMDDRLNKTKDVDQIEIDDPLKIELPDDYVPVYDKIVPIPQGQKVDSDESTEEEEDVPPVKHELVKKRIKKRKKKEKEHEYTPFSSQCKIPNTCPEALQIHAIPVPPVT